VGGTTDGGALARENERLRAELERLRGVEATGGVAPGELDALLRGLGILVFTFDAEDRFLEYRADRSSDLYVPPEAFVGRRVDEVIPPPLGGRMLEAVRAARAGQSPAPLGYSLAMAGAPRDFEARFVPLARGRVAALVLDVSERTRAERAARASEERFRIAFTTSPDAIAITRLSDRVYVGVNAGFTRLTGWSEAEVVGRSSSDLEFWTDPADRERLVAALGATGAAENLEAHFRMRDGSVRVGLISARLIDVGGETCVLSVTRDVSELKRAEAERDRLEGQMNEARRLESLGQLAGGVAHDFNNLLTVILGCAEELQEGGGEAPEAVGEIREAAERARDLTRQLLSFARRQVIDPRPMDLNELVRGSERLLRRVAGEDVDVVVDLAPSLWAIRADPAQLQQALVNLATNARDAMPRGGKLTVETSNVVLEAPSHEGVAPGPYVLLAVSDSGEGMSAEARKHAFEPFFTTKPLGHGTGLGLAAVYGVVKQSGGHIWLYSEAGEGTTFKLHFPRVDAAPRPAEVPAARAAAPGGSETVLLVEDDPGVREVTLRALRGAGYDVSAAVEGREALALAATLRDRLRLVVTDVVLPGRSGREVADEIARLVPGVRVLFVSGYTRNTIVHHGVLEPGVEFLPKPFTGAALLERVRALLDRP
jgi:PAS domain S-box-containing protein